MIFKGIQLTSSSTGDDIENDNEGILGFNG